MANLEPITAAPAAFVTEAEKINAALSVCRAVKAMRGSGGIKVTVADGNILVSVNADTLAANLDGVGLGRRTFFVARDNDTPANLLVSAGAINNVYYAGGTLTTPANGDKVYIDVTISGSTVTAVTVSKAASVPANTSTHVYKLLASVAVASSIATPTPVGWNFTEVQLCGSYASAYWGGFGE